MNKASGQLGGEILTSADLVTETPQMSVAFMFRRPNYSSQPL
jgi:hypothetical protein